MSVRLFAAVITLALFSAPFSVAAADAVPCDPPKSDQQGWNVTTVYSGEDGEDQFGITTLPWSPDSAGILRTSPVASRPWFVSEAAFNPRQQPYHVGKDTVMILFLQGEQRITVANGESHVMKPGNPFIFRDTGGHGHAAQEIGGEDIRFLVIPLNLDAFDQVTKRSW